MRLRRPRMSELRRLAQLHASEREAAASLGLTLKRFKEIMSTDLRAQQAWEEGMSSGKINLRRKQLRLAERNPSMAIFLGKQWLGQSDVSVHEHSGRDGGPILASAIDLKQLDQNERKELRKLIGRARKS